MINYHALQKATLINSPFKYSRIQHLLNEEDARQLRTSLPDENYYRSIRMNGSDKTYNVINNILFQLEDQASSNLDSIPRCWQDFLKDVTNQTYRSYLGKLLEIDLGKCYQEITLKIYEEGDFLSVHTDKSGVIATHMIFFNEHWQDNWGGQLLFSAEKNHPPFAKFNPVWLESVAFVRTDHSWHAVSPVTTLQSARIALQVAFWHNNQRRVSPGRIEQQIDHMDY